jgi:DNA-binding transcriptional LysR family regulator
MNNRFDGIAEFVAVARLSSFTAAAVELGVTKSAVGRGVSRLEARLGAKLLHRTTRRLTLTSDGEAWLEHCLAALAELDRGEDVLSVAQLAPSGRVRIDVPTPHGRQFIMPLLLGLAERFPALMLNVSFTDRQVDLIGEGIDLAVRIGTLDDTPDLVARRLGVQQLVICGAPAYLAARGWPLGGGSGEARLHCRLAQPGPCLLATTAAGRFHGSPCRSGQT